MKTNNGLLIACLVAVMPVGVATLSTAAPKAAETQLTMEGRKKATTDAGREAAKQSH